MTRLIQLVIEVKHGNWRQCNVAVKNLHHNQTLWKVFFFFRLLERFNHGLDIDYIVDIKSKCEVLKSFKMRLKDGLCLILENICVFPFFTLFALVFCIKCSYCWEWNLLFLIPHLEPPWANTQIQIHQYRYTNTNTPIWIHKYKYTNIDTQIQIHQYRYTNTNTQI